MQNNINSLAESKAALVKGQTKTIRINWPINEASAKSNAVDGIYLPLDGATVAIVDSDKYGGAAPIYGKVIEGEFTFTVPRNDYRYTVYVMATYKECDCLSTCDHPVTFNINIFRKTESKAPETAVIQIEDTFFEKNNVFNIREGVPDNTNGSYISFDQACCFSVFQAIKELHTLAKVELGVEKTVPNDVYYTPDVQGSVYNTEFGKIVICSDAPFFWDVIGHEFGHALAKENKVTQGAPGGIHTTNRNIYDFDANDKCHNNKDNSLKLAFDEGYGDWIGVYLWKHLRSFYKSTLEEKNDVGDETFNGSSTIKIDLEKVGGEASIYGEDGEFAIARIFWDLTDNECDSNVRAISNYRNLDEVYIQGKQFYNSVLANKSHRNVSDFYQALYPYYTDSAVGKLETLSETANVTDLLNKTHDLGLLFAEQGIAPYISADDNSEFSQLFSNSQTKLNWKQMKTGRMPGCDEFELLFFSREDDQFKLIHTLKAASENLTLPKQGDSTKAEEGAEYEYTLKGSELNELKGALMPLCYKNKNPLNANDAELYVIIKGAASGKGTGGAIPTGPYYSPVEKLMISGPKTSRQILLAVDDSGSNSWSDPDNKRFELVNDLLKGFVKRNNDIFSNKNNSQGELPSIVIFFSIHTGYGFYNPQTLLDENIIIGQMESQGPTDFLHYYYLINENIKGMGSVSYPNQSQVYIISDCENRAGVLLDDVDNKPGRPNENQYTEKLPILEWHFWEIEELYEAITLAEKHSIKVNLLQYACNDIPQVTTNPRPKPNPDGSYPDDWFKDIYFGDFYKGIMPYSITLTKNKRNIGLVGHDEIIQSVLDTGGTYSEIKFDEEYGKHNTFTTNMLTQKSEEKLNQICCVADVKLFDQMSQHKTSCCYLYTAPASGSVIVEVDTKGHFTPMLSVNGSGKAIKISENIYQIQFETIENEIYRIDLTVPENSKGIYSILLRELALSE